MNWNISDDKKKNGNKKKLKRREDIKNWLTWVATAIGKGKRIECSNAPHIHVEFANFSWKILEAFSHRKIGQLDWFQYENRFAYVKFGDIFFKSIAIAGFLSPFL